MPERGGLHGVRGVVEGEEVNESLVTILQGDWIEQLKTLPDESFQCVVTSPPYWGLRDYGIEGQLGLEKTPQEYVAKIVAGFQEVKRVLKNDGTLWLNLGDCYSGSGKGGNPEAGKQATNKGSQTIGTLYGKVGETARIAAQTNVTRRICAELGMAPKQLIGIPWRVAFALQADGWYLRSDIIWSKPNPMPESVTDRPTRAHEYIFLLTKSAKYYYNHEAIKEPASPELVKQVEDGYNGSAVKDYLNASVQDASATKSRIINNARKRIDKQRGHGRRHAGFNDKWDALTPAEQILLGSNKRSVWTVAPANYREAHFATFPPALITPCILAGTKSGDRVLDPFGGSGTAGMVAVQLGRVATLIELNPEYVKLIERRTDVQPGLRLD